MTTTETIAAVIAWFLVASASFMWLVVMPTIGLLYLMGYLK